MFPKIFGSNIDHMKADLPIVKTIRRLSREIELSKPGSPHELQSLRKSLFGKKGSIVRLFEEFRNLPSDQKREIGIMLNDLKKTAGAKLDEFESNGWSGKAKLDERYRDPMLPAIPFRCGSLHPLNIVRTNLLKTLMKQGFEIVTGPEIESEWHNFGALNFPANHPAREMQDTYFIKGEKDFLLRTHTSNVQIRLMTDPASPPPLKKIIPGRVYRNEVISSRSHCFFHQIEGLWVDSNVSFLDLRECLIHFTKDYFGSETRIRIRPSFFSLHRAERRDRHPLHDLQGKGMQPLQVHRLGGNCGVRAGTRQRLFQLQP